VPWGRMTGAVPGCPAARRCGRANSTTGGLTTHHHYVPDGNDLDVTPYLLEHLLRSNKRSLPV
jgi:hypothetical protein